jgi:hypothetical protein
MQWPGHGVKMVGVGLHVISTTFEPQHATHRLSCQPGSGKGNSKGFTSRPSFKFVPLTPFRLLRPCRSVRGKSRFLMGDMALVGSVSRMSSQDPIKSFTDLALSTTGRQVSPF